MAQQNNPLPLILALLLTGGILGGGVWYLLSKQKVANTPAETVAIDSAVSTPAPNAPPAIAPTTTFPIPTEVASGTQVFIDGSTSMVQMNVALKDAFERQFAGTRVDLAAQGSSAGIAALIAGTADVAASSRPLKPEEASTGLKTIAVAPDQIALVVGKDNPFRAGLTTQQATEIFTGKITNWSAVGGPDAPIRVLNRPVVSGTHTSLKELVLKGQDVSSPGVTTLERDETTGMLRQLGTDGIGYATYTQIANQATVRPVAVDNHFPGSADYPYQRQLLYVYQEPASEAAQAFLGFLGTPEGQAAIAP